MFMNIGKNGLLCAAAAMKLYFLAVLIPFAAAAEGRQLIIERSDQAALVLNVELADTPQSRASGLMGRRQLPSMGGMIFDFKKDQFITMWMKNTNISLDMIFIDSAGVIKKIVTHTKPQTTELISSQMPVRAVLEVAAGFSEKYNVTVGNKIVHDIFQKRN